MIVITLLEWGGIALLSIVMLLFLGVILVIGVTTIYENAREMHEKKTGQILAHHKTEIKTLVQEYWEDLEKAGAQ